jgi:type VI protein secretion system component VasF
VVLRIGARFEYLPVKVAFLLAALVAFSVFGWNHVLDAAGRNLMRAILAPLRSRSASV